MEVSVLTILRKTRYICKYKKFRIVYNHLIISHFLACLKKTVNSLEHITNIEIYIMSVKTSDTCCLKNILHTVSERNLCSCLRSNIERRNCSAESLNAINLNAPLHHVAGKIDEEILIIYIHLSGKYIYRSCKDGSVLICNFISVRMQCAVGSDDSVATE